MPCLYIQNVCKTWLCDDLFWKPLLPLQFIDKSGVSRANQILVEVFSNNLTDFLIGSGRHTAVTCLFNWICKTHPRSNHVNLNNYFFTTSCTEVISLCRPTSLISSKSYWLLLQPTVVGQLTIIKFRLLSVLLAFTQYVFWFNTECSCNFTVLKSCLLLFAH